MCSIAYRIRPKCFLLPFQSLWNLFWISFPILFAVSPPVYFSLHLNASHSSLFLPRYIWGISASFQPFDHVWNTRSPTNSVFSSLLTRGWACTQGGRTYSRRTPRRAATAGFSSSLLWPQMLPEDLKCGNVRATKDRDMMRWRGTETFFRRVKILKKGLQIAFALKSCFLAHPQLPSYRKLLTDLCLNFLSCLHGNNNTYIIGLWEFKS